MKRYTNNGFDLENHIDCFDETPIWSAPFGLKLLDKVEYKLNIKALDIGFGTGFPLTELAMRLGKSSKVYGIDPWKKAIERTKRKIAFYQIPNIELIEGVAEKIPLDDQSIDLIVSNNGINNVDDMLQVFSECNRILKPGGQFVMTMNTDLSMFEFYTALEKILLEMNLTEEVAHMYEHIHQKRRPVTEVIHLLQNNGFIIKDIEQHQFNYTFADATAMFDHYFIRLAFMQSWQKLLPENQVELIFETIEQRLNQQALEIESFKLSIPFVLVNIRKPL